MYAVIFTSKLRDPAPGYDETSARMEELCREQPGFVSIESVRGADGVGITVCRWESLDAIAAWSANPEHAEAQRRGAQEWYETYETTVCEVAVR